MDETTLQELRRLDPGHQFHMDPISGVIAVVVDGVDVEDPFKSESGFPCCPNYYGLHMGASLVMVRHNMECTA